MSSISLRASLALPFVIAASLASAPAVAQNPHPDFNSSTLGWYEQNDRFRSRAPEGYQISAVQVRHGSFINNMRLQFRRRDRVGSTIWGDWFGTRMDGGTVSTFTVPEGDYLSSFGGDTRTTGGHQLTMVFLRTKSGGYARYGTVSGGSYTGHGGPGEEVVGFKGAANRYVRGLISINREPGTEFSKGQQPLPPIGTSSWQIHASHHPIWGHLNLGRLEVRHDGSNILGLRALIRETDRQTPVRFTSWVGLAGGGTVTGFDIPSDDFLESVSVSRNNQTHHLEGLRFRTRGNLELTVGSAGLSGWEEFTHPGHEITSLWGKTFGPVISTLGVTSRVFRNGHILTLPSSGCTGEPQLTVTGTPTVFTPNQSLVFEMIDDPFAARALFLGPPSQQSFGTCNLWIDWSTSIAFPFVGNEATVPILDIPSLVGELLYAQAVKVELGGPILGVATASNPIAVRFGVHEIN